jgi:hypothetical protein
MAAMSRHIFNIEPFVRGVFENVDTKPYILHGFWSVNKA